jgi:hypothetical protein
MLWCEKQIHLLELNRQQIKEEEGEHGQKIRHTCPNNVILLIEIWSRSLVWKIHLAKLQSSVDVCLWQERTYLRSGKSKEDPSESAKPKRQKTNKQCFDLTL